MRNANHTCLKKKKSKLDFSPKRAVLWPLPPPPHCLYCFCVTKRYWKKSQRYIGDGINDRRCFYICTQILVVALSAIFFSYVYLFDIIFSVGLHSCHPVDHWPTYQAFLKDLSGSVERAVSVSELQKRFDNKTLTGNPFLTLPFFFFFLLISLISL